MIKTYATAVVLAVVIVIGGLLLFLTPAPNRVPENPLGQGSSLEDPSFTYYQSTDNDIQVSLPFPGATTGQDFSVRGQARGYWFFEASFPVFLFDKDGNQIAVAVAAPEPPGTEWMTEEFINFKADLNAGGYTGPATLLLARDNASGLPEHDKYVHFPITIDNLGMAELKTKKNKASVTKFIDSVKDPVRRADAKELLKIFKKATGMKPQMWGTSIIGYGSYHYKSERSTQEGDWPLTGFSPRVQAMTVYVMPGYRAPGYKKVLKKIGKHKLGGSCLYFKRLADIDEKAVIELIKLGVSDMKKKYAWRQS